MRNNITKKHSTKAERIFAEILKRNKIQFKHRVIINEREIDFIIGKFAIEIDGHPQDSKRNKWLFSLGYSPLHYNNKALLHEREKVEEIIINRFKNG